MVGVLRDQHVSQQCRTGQAALDGPRRSGRLDHMFAGGAGELRPHVTNHLETGRDAFQLFGDIFTKLAQGAAAIGTAVVRGKMGDHFTRKSFRIRLSNALCSCAAFSGALDL